MYLIFDNIFFHITFVYSKKIYVKEKTQNTEPLLSQKKWYAIRVTYNRELKVKDDLDKKTIKSFLPMKYKKYRKNVL